MLWFSIAIHTEYFIKREVIIYSGITANTYRMSVGVYRTVNTLKCTHRLETIDYLHRYNQVGLNSTQV